MEPTGLGSTGTEPIKVQGDEFLNWVQGALVRHGATDPLATEELTRLQELAADADHEVASLNRARRRESLPDLSNRHNTMDPKWLARWLTFDLDRLDELDETPVQFGTHNAALVDNTTIELVADYIDRGDTPTPLGILDLANFVDNLILRDNLFALDHRLSSRCPSHGQGRGQTAPTLRHGDYCRDTAVDTQAEHDRPVVVPRTLRNDTYIVNHPGQRRAASGEDVRGPARGRPLLPERARVQGQEGGRRQRQPLYYQQALR
jgi:hypothetical protein